MSKTSKCVREWIYWMKIIKKRKLQSGWSRSSKEMMRFITNWIQNHDKIKVFGDVKMGRSRYGSKTISWVTHWIQNSWNKHEAFRFPIPISEIQSHWTSKSTSTWTSNRIEANTKKAWSCVNVCVCVCVCVCVKM